MDRQVLRQRSVVSRPLELRRKHSALEDPAVMKDGRRLYQTYQELEQAQKTVDGLYARWAELEEKIG